MRPLRSSAVIAICSISLIAGRNAAKASGNAFLSRGKPVVQDLQGARWREPLLIVISLFTAAGRPMPPRISCARCS